MRILALAVSCLFVAGIAAAQAAEPSAASAEQFVRGLYAKYTPKGTPTAFVYPDARNIVDPAMLALLKTDHDKSGGEVGAMDSDPVCDCQDWDKLTITSLNVTLKGNIASTDVSFTNAGSKEKMHFSLVWIKDGWRIHDIGTKDQPSLVTYLKTYKY